MEYVSWAKQPTKGATKNDKSNKIKISLSRSYLLTEEQIIEADDKKMDSKDWNDLRTACYLRGPAKSPKKLERDTNEAG